MTQSQQALSRQIHEYYREMEELYAIKLGEGNPLTPILDAYDAEHPGLDVWQLKAAQYRILAENMKTVIFDGSPFYFANNMCFRDGKQLWSAGGWLQRRNTHIYRDADPETFDMFRKQQDLHLYLCCGPYADEMHFCFPVGNLIRMGLRGGYEKIQQAKQTANEEELKFLNCAEAGILSAKRVAERFAEEAEQKRAALPAGADTSALDLLIRSARHAPWEPCAHFFEGLNTMYFCRNVMGTMDGIGNSHLGRPDLDLIDLYRRDIESGYLTEDEAYELVCKFILHGDYDNRTKVSDLIDGEMEIGYVLGGCDKDGRPVYNEITKMFLRAHREMNALYPKLHCRVAPDASEEFLQELAKDYVGGHSVLGISFDESHIPALLNDGLSLEDARGYVCTGCWSAISEGNESVPASSNLYLLTILEQSVYPDDPRFKDCGFRFEQLDGCADFEQLYRTLLRNITMVIDFRNRAIGQYGRLAAKVNPLTLCSAFMNGCIEKKKDYTQGGARYNRNTIDPGAFANIVDALLAMKTICFERKTVTLSDYLDAVRHNWEGHEELLHAVRCCPHFGDADRDSMEIAQRLHYDLYEAARKYPNERGGKYSVNYYLYREFMFYGQERRATPDGRRDGDLFALGIGPSRYHAPDALTDMASSVGTLNPALCNVSSLDLNIPMGQNGVEQVAVLLRALGKVGVKHLQMNVVDVNKLRDAQKHPELYGELIVRVCGFSARFVELSPDYQEEFINRFVYE